MATTKQPIVLVCVNCLLSRMVFFIEVMKFCGDHCESEVSLTEVFVNKFDGKK